MQKLQTILLDILTLVGAGNAGSLDGRKESRCKPFKGDFTIHQYQLYPENADFDFNSCLVYTG